MRRPPELFSAYQSARRNHGDALENPHLLQATLLSEVIKRPSTSPSEKGEAVHDLFQEYRALVGVEAAA